MLNNQIANLVTPLAIKIANEESVISPLTDSPLSNLLTGCSLAGLFYNGKTIEDYSLEEAVSHIVEESKVETVDGLSEHDHAFSEVKGLAARGISSLLNLTRNVVIPDIKEVVKKTEELLSGYVNNTMDPFVVVMKEIPEVFFDPLMMELVEKYSETPARQITRRQLPVIEQEVLISSIKTGADGFDEKVLSLLSTDGIAWVSEAFSGNIELTALNPEYSIALHLLCKNMYDEPPKETRLSLSDYNDHISRMVEQTGRIAYQTIEQFRRKQKTSSLYAAPSKIVEGYREIVVDGNTYRKMLSEGLVPEVLFGNELLGRKYMASGLLEAKEELITVYNREMRLRSTKSRLERSGKVREYLEKAISLMINERDEDELPVDRGTLHRRLSDSLSNINDYEFDNVPMLCRNVVCHVFYAHTDAKRLIVIGDRLGTEYPDVDVREIMLLATIEYVSLWMAKQMVVEKHV